MPLFIDTLGCSWKENFIVSIVRYIGKYKRERYYMSSEARMELGEREEDHATTLW